MGWDIHFSRTRKIGDILADEEFGIDFEEDGAYIYTTDEEGNRSGLFCPGVIKDDDYKNKYLIYGYISYNSRLSLFLWKLYTKFGVWFADTELDDLFYLQGDCESEEEEDALCDYCYAIGTLYFIGENLPQDNELTKVVEKTKPVRDRIYERYVEKNKEHFKDYSWDGTQKGLFDALEDFVKEAEEDCKNLNFEEDEDGTIRIFPLDDTQ